MFFVSMENAGLAGALFVSMRNTGVIVVDIGQFRSKRGVGCKYGKDSGYARLRRILPEKETRRG